MTVTFPDDCLCLQGYHPTFVEVKTMPHQTNSHDCGVYACATAAWLATWLQGQQQQQQQQQQQLTASQGRSLPLAALAGGCGLTCSFAVLS
jgi:hypothetical protein